MKKTFILVVFISFIQCSKNHGFEVFETLKGVQICENSKKVLNYNTQEIEFLSNQFKSHYIHPLYGLDGKVVLTEDSPQDHIHHRGIFWAWHQVFADTVNLGDSWFAENIRLKPKMFTWKKTETTVELKTKLEWYSSVMNRRFMSESSKIVIHALKGGSRRIDFEIKLKSLVEKLKIGGDASVKEYGGFSPRLKMCKDLKFYTKKGEVKAKPTPILSDSFMSFVSKFGGDELLNIKLFQDKQNPKPTNKWILRKKGSMQNAVWPGRELYEFKRGEEVILRYRLVLSR
jgi:hypothetical protein